MEEQCPREVIKERSLSGGSAHFKLCFVHVNALLKVRTFDACWTRDDVVTFRVLNFDSDSASEDSA